MHPADRTNMNNFYMKKDLYKRVKDRSLTEEKILNATGSAIKKAGYQNLSISMVSKEANVSRKIIYRYFKDLPGLKEAYILKNDYWLVHQQQLKDPCINTHNREEVKAFLKDVLRGQFNYFFDNEAMRRIILEELTRKDPLLSSIHNVRQALVRNILQIIDPYFSDLGPMIHAVLAILVNSTYQLILRGYSNGSCINGIDMMSSDGRESILNAIDHVLDLIFSGCPEFLG